MAEYRKVLSVSELPDGSMKTVTIEGKSVAIAKIDQEFFAVSDRCSHEECSLGTEGFLDGSVITCGCHGAQFDITTGNVLQLPATQPIVSYKVKVEGNDILVLI